MSLAIEAGVMGAELHAENARLRAANERLRIALRPFALLGRELGDGVLESIIWKDETVIEGARAYNHGKDYVITLGDLRRASAALTQAEAPTSPADPQA